MGPVLAGCSLTLRVTSATVLRREFDSGMVCRGRHAVRAFMASRLRSASVGSDDEMGSVRRSTGRAWRWKKLAGKAERGISRARRDGGLGAEG